MSMEVLAKIEVQGCVCGGDLRLLPQMQMFVALKEGVRIKDAFLSSTAAVKFPSSEWR